MTHVPCPLTEHRSRDVGVSRKHLSECLDCRESERIAAWMHEFDKQTHFPEGAASPGLILFKARRLEKQRAQRWVVMPILLAQAGSSILGAVIAAWILLTNPMGILPKILQGFRSLSNVDSDIVLGGLGLVLISSAIGYFAFGRRIKAESSDLFSRS